MRTTNSTPSMSAMARSTPNTTPATWPEPSALLALSFLLPSPFALLAAVLTVVLATLLVVVAALVVAAVALVVVAFAVVVAFVVVDAFAVVAVTVVDASAVALAVALAVVLAVAFTAVDTVLTLPAVAAEGVVALAAVAFAVDAGASVVVALGAARDDSLHPGEVPLPGTVDGPPVTHGGDDGTPTGSVVVTVVPVDAGDAAAVVGGVGGGLLVFRPDVPATSTATIIARLPHEVALLCRILRASPWVLASFASSGTGESESEGGQKSFNPIDFFSRRNDGHKYAS